MGSASASGVGAAVRWPVGARAGIELETELRRAEITAVNVALSLVYDLPTIGRVTPYVAAGVGLERFGKAYCRPDGAPLLGSDTGLTVNAGGGPPHAREQSVGRPQRCALAARLGPRRDGTSGASTTAPRSASAASAESGLAASSLKSNRSSNGRGI